jgi:hypothetical protein
MEIDCGTRNPAALFSSLPLLAQNSKNRGLLGHFLCCSLGVQLKEEI